MHDSCIFSQTGVIEISHLMTEVLDELCWCTANRRGWWVSEAVFLLTGNCSHSSQRINIWINHRGINLLLCTPPWGMPARGKCVVFLFVFLFFWFCVCVCWEEITERLYWDLVLIDPSLLWIPCSYVKRCVSVKRWKDRMKAQMCVCVCVSESPR